MISIKNICLASAISLFSVVIYADGCCSKMGGASYCDSSAGRVVCKNGFYSACYCNRHAVMDLQLLKGCCLWHGGVLPNLQDPSNLVVCNDGYVSEECSLQDSTKTAGIF